MENVHSGLVTPPIVSPRPIQTQKPPPAEDSWRIVGSPPRRPLLSPPEEREQSGVLQNIDTNTVDGNPCRLVGATNTDIVDSADSTDSSISLLSTGNSGSSSTSTASSSSSPASESVPQYSGDYKDVTKDSTTSSDDLHRFSAIGSSTVTSRSPFALDLAGDSIPPVHFKSSSTGTIGSTHLVSLSDHSSFIGINDIISPSDLGRAVGGRRGSLKQTGSMLQSSPLSLGSFIWGDHTSKDRTSTTAESSSMSYLKNNIGSSSVQKWTEVATNNTAVGNSTNTNRHRSASLFDLLPSDPIGGIPRTSRSLSFSEPSFSSSLGLGYGFGPSRAGYDQDDEDVLRFRPPLTIMEEEYEDSIEPRLRARSCSSSAVSLDAFPNGLPSMFTTGSGSKDPFGVSSGSKATMGNSQPPSMNRQLSDELSAWPTSTRSEAASSSHRRSITTMSSYGTPIWESSCPVQPLPAPIERDRQRLARRFSVAPSSDFRNYGVFLDDVEAGNSSALSLNRFDSDTVHQQVQRRHSVAGFGESYRRSSTTAFALTSSLESLQLENDNQTGVWGLNEELHEEDVNPGHGSNTKELGKGVSLGQLPHRGALYVVEFKAGRNDLFYVTESSGLSLKSGDLVIVEADRGKDLGKITHDSITPQHIQALQEHQAEMAAMQLQQEGVAAGNGSHRAAKEIHPKRIFRLAQSSEISQLIYKNQDEIKAMIVCQSKVRQKRLPMEVVDAEYQWDRRKLTFYFVAERRIDFRELVRDLFKIYKTRIWMYAVSPSMAQSSIGRLHSGSSPLHVNAHIDHRMEQQQQQHQQQQPAFHQPKQQQYHLDAHPVCHQGYRYGSNYGCSQGDATAGAASSMGPHPHSSLLGAMSTSTYPHSQHSRSQHFQY